MNSFRLILAILLVIAGFALAIVSVDSVAKILGVALAIVGIAMLIIVLRQRRSNRGE